jgi:hypothetical protein
LFGTPHRGLVVDDFYEMVREENGEAEFLLQQLREGSMFFEDQGDALSQMWESFRGRIITFYETKKTNRIRKVHFSFVRYIYVYNCTSLNRMPKFTAFPSGISGEPV